MRCRDTDLCLCRVLDDGREMRDGWKDDKRQDNEDRKWTRTPEKRLYEPRLFKDSAAKNESRGWKVNTKKRITQQSKWAICAPPFSADHFSVSVGFCMSFFCKRVYLWVTAEGKKIEKWDFDSQKILPLCLKKKRKAALMTSIILLYTGFYPGGCKKIHLLFPSWLVSK